MNRDQVILTQKKINFCRLDFAGLHKAGKQQDHEMIMVVLVDFRSRGWGDHIFKIQRMELKIFPKVIQVFFFGIDDIHPTQIFCVYDFEGHFVSNLGTEYKDYTIYGIIMLTFGRSASETKPLAKIPFLQ